MSRREKRMSGAFILLLLMAVFAALIGLYFLIGHLNEQSVKKDEENNILPEFAEINLDNVDTFSYDYDGTLQTFFKSGDEWIYAEDENLKLDSDLVDSVLQALDELKYEKIVAETLATSSEYGFDEPKMTVTVSLSDGTQKILYIGSQNPMTNEYYAVAEGDDNIYAISSQTVDAFLPVSDLEAADDTEEENDAGDTDGETSDTDETGDSTASSADASQSDETE